MGRTTSRRDITSPLAERYASKEVYRLWHPRNVVLAERRLWLTVLKAQQSAGLLIDGQPISDEAIADYERVIRRINLSCIREIESRTRHDVKARIEAFNELAGHQLIHMGMTSRDATDNTEQHLLRESLLLIRERVVGTIELLSRRALEYSSLPVAGRTHNVPAQMLTLGKRFSNALEELLIGFGALEHLISTYPLRGIKGAVGTQLDMLTLLGSQENVDELERRVAHDLGFDHVMTSVGQVYPRSLDFQLISVLYQLCCSMGSLATTMRLMAGDEQFTEGFKPGRTGSSAMPHKMNASACERVAGLIKALLGFLMTAAANAGTQWYEGDVSCSVARRVALSSAIFAADGVFQSMLTILLDCGVYSAVMEEEIDRYLPFLASSTLLMAAVAKGMGREDAHAAIKRHAVAAVLRMRESGAHDNDLVARLGADEDFPLSAHEVSRLLGDPLSFCGSSERQVWAVVARAVEATLPYAAALKYRPDPIL